MTRHLAHHLSDEFSPRSMAHARRRIERRLQARPLPPCPSWCRYDGPHSHMDDEHWGPVKIATFVVFAVGFVYSIVTIAAVMA